MKAFERFGAVKGKRPTAAVPPLDSGRQPLSSTSRPHSLPIHPAQPGGATLPGRLSPLRHIGDSGRGPIKRELKIDEDAGKLVAVKSPPRNRPGGLATSPIRNTNGTADLSIINVTDISLHSATTIGSSPARGQANASSIDSSHSLSALQVHRYLANDETVRASDVEGGTGSSGLPALHDYIERVTDVRLAVKEADQVFPRLTPILQKVTIDLSTLTQRLLSFKIAQPIDSVQLPGALGFEILDCDSTFFLPDRLPHITADGVLHVDPKSLSLKTGSIPLTYRLVDYSNFVDVDSDVNVATAPQTLTLEFVSPTASITTLQTTTGRALTDWRSHHHRAHSEKVIVDTMLLDDGPTMESPNRTGSPQPFSHSNSHGRVSLKPLNIHSFREEGPALTPVEFAAKVLLYEPLLLLRLCNSSAERQLLANSDLPPTEMEPILTRVKELMGRKAPVAETLPVLDQACRLHFRCGTKENMKTAQRLVRLRAQLVAASLSIDLKQEDTFEVSAALRLASAKHSQVQQLIRVLVEGAHLLKITGELGDALKYYKLAFHLASVVNDANRSASMIPFLVATGDVYLMRGEFESALDCHERARALAEMSGGGPIVAECEDLVGLSYALLGHHVEAQNALSRSLKIREETDIPVATAESLLFNVFCSAVRGSKHQAHQLLEQAIGLLEASATQDHEGHGHGERLMLMVAHCLAAWLRFDEPFHAEIQGRLQKAVELCQPLNLQGLGHNAEICLPLWLLYAYETKASSGAGGVVAESEHGKRRWSALMTAAAHHGLETTSFGSAVKMTMALVADRPAATDLCREALEPLVNYSSQHPLLLYFFEIHATMSFQNRNYDTAVSALSKLLGTLTPMLKEAILKDQTSIRLSSLSAKILASCMSDSAFRVESTDTVQEVDRLLQWIASEHKKKFGEVSSKVLPLLLDSAELRYLNGKYDESLELFGKALRIADRRNLIYLLGSLFNPENMLTASEVKDRNRLARERGEVGESAVPMGCLLAQVATVHEMKGAVEAAVVGYHKALAVFEMAEKVDHPCVPTVLSGLARVLLSAGRIGEAFMYAEKAEDAVQSYHYQFGGFKSSPLLCRVVEDTRRTLHAVTSSMWMSRYLLVKSDAPQVGVPPESRIIVYL
jgi:tetratricopeptide (TPR) repeat protein